MSGYENYVSAAMVACPRCRVAMGKKCVARACRNGYRDCDYAVCSYWRELDEPHLERAVAARLAADPAPLREVDQ